MTQVDSLKDHQLLRSRIANTIAEIDPYDDLEQHHIQESITWLQGNLPIFRIKKPDLPPKHLVCYFLLIDQAVRKVLLVDHKLAGLWLPTGGHVEIDEYPQQTVVRECYEELEVEADFYFQNPLFLTSTRTVGLTGNHTDVTLWYVLKGDHNKSYKYDKDEFKDIKWFHFDDIPYGLTDPHMKRFVQKLGGCL